MGPDRWAQVEKLYHAAAAQPREQRVAFLEESCGDDGELRREVESLLARETAAADFLEVPALEEAGKARIGVDSIGTMDDSLGIIGETLSHYRIIEKLGG
jgi:hypothetical protein